MRRLSRRTALRGIGSVVLAGYLTQVTANDVAARPEATPNEWTPDTWMRAWMEQSRTAVGMLYVGRFADPIYFLTQPITWKPNKGQEHYKEVTVPVGFVTDFASIPRLFWSLLRPDGNYAYAAVLHDYLYWTQERPRGECDMILKLGMEDFSINTTTVRTIYDAVRTGGGPAWSENARLRRAGEKRILKRLPQDPTTTWKVWQRDAGNF
jgi:hypothetical protein